jgi:hypothetical protein
VGSLVLSLPAEQVMDGGGGGGRTGGLSGSMSTGTARNGGRVSGTEHVGSHVMDEGGGGGGTGELSGSMSTGTVRNGGRVSGQYQWAYWSLAYQQSR